MTPERRTTRSSTVTLRTDKRRLAVFAAAARLLSLRRAECRYEVLLVLLAFCPLAVSLEIVQRLLDIGRQMLVLRLHVALNALNVAFEPLAVVDVVLRGRTVILHELNINTYSYTRQHAFQTPMC